MDTSFDTFERYRRKGLDARRAGQWEPARIYLLEAARAMVGLSKAARGEELREARRQTAQRLLELARDCEEAAVRKRRPPGVGRRSSRAEASPEGGGGSADQWVVREKPNVGFDDVAGL